MNEMLKNMLDFNDLPDLSNDAKNILSYGNGELFKSHDNYFLVINKNIFLKLDSNGKMKSPIKEIEFQKESPKPIFIKPLIFA